MRTHSMLTHGDHYYILKNHEFLEGSLKGDQLRRFKQMIDKIGTSIDYHCNPKKGGSGMGARLKEMLAVLDDCAGEEGLSKTFRKLAIIHIFIQKAGSSGSLNEELSKAAFEELERVQKREFKALTKEKGGVMGELRQIFKDLTNKHNIPQCLQKQNSKTVLKEIVNKIYRPFKMYLLRIVQDGDLYSFLMQKVSELPQSILWKVVNLCKQLGSLIMQLNRIVRYFRQDLSGIYCHFIYLISIDINHFYDLLRSEASQKCSMWRSIVQQIQSQKHKDHLAYQIAKETLLKDPEFIQTKRLIEQLAAIREDLIWIYMNKELRCCLKYFKRPARGIQIEIDPETNHVIYLQNFIETEASSPLQNHKNKRKISIELEQNVCMLLKQIEHTEISTGTSISDGQFEEDHHIQQSQ